MADREGPRVGRENGPGAATPAGRSGLIAWNKSRRARKKRRIAKLSRPKRILRKFAVIGTWFLALLTVMSVTVVALFYALSNVPRPESLPLPQVATIEYSDGSTLARIGTVDRTIVALDQVPVLVRYDVLAAEDRNFYSEPGVSIKGTLRAALSDLTGGDTQGGSGITQQYAKNAYLSDSRTLTRKLKELMISVKLSRDYSKDQILDFYLNTVYFGRGTYGIQAAAQTYFGQDVSKLTVSQGAVLASLLRDPGYYDPEQNPAAAKGRWQYVITGMVKIGKLTPAQADALTYPKVRPASASSQLGATGPAYFIYRKVVAELEANGVTEAEINTRGLRIQTTINRKAQQAALTAIHDTFSNLTKQQRNYKNALAAVNPSSGAVLAYYGGPNGNGYNGKPDYNDYAGQRSRPAGSSFKPYTLSTVLSQTLDKTKGKPPTTISTDVDGSQCVSIQGVRICNDPTDSGYSGSSVTVAYAMKHSLNTTFDQLAVQAGPDNVAKTAHAMGISAKDSDGNPTLVDSDGNTGFGIGIGDYAVSPLDQAVGFATLANGGTANAPYFVQRVTDSSGALVYQHKSALKSALNGKVANDVTMSLEPIAASSGFPLDNPRESAAKTGTVGIGTSSPQNSDAWTVGYTPQVSAAVWAGSGDSTHAIYDSNGNAEYGRDLPGRTWQAFMNAYLAGQPDLPMASKQMVFGGSDTGIKTPPATPTTTPPATASSSTSPSPTFSIKTTFSPVPPITPSTTPTRTPPPSISPTPICPTPLLPNPSCPPGSPGP
ncbi:MAG: transglycosylase domain-containing protein [Jatrophihabitantaceae bacterium]